MKILMIGDIYGKSGRQILEQKLPEIKKKYVPDLIIANAENITHGKSMNDQHYQFLKKLGIDFMTMGNHTFFRKITITKILTENKDIVRPLNYKAKMPGVGSRVIKIKGKTIRITNMMTEVFMNVEVNSPFESMDELLLSKTKTDIHIVDLHGETTAEKMAFAIDFDGRLTAVLGTHTHVQTADNKILPHGTAFISDVGMTGPYHSVIGANPYEVIQRHRKSPDGRFHPARGAGQLCAVVLDIDEKTNKAKTIERINITP